MSRRKELDSTYQHLCQDQAEECGFNASLFQTPPTLPSSNAHAQTKSKDQKTLLIVSSNCSSRAETARAAFTPIRQVLFPVTRSSRLASSAACTKHQTRTSLSLGRRRRIYTTYLRWQTVDISRIKRGRRRNAQGCEQPSWLCCIIRRESFRHGVAASQ